MTVGTPAWLAASGGLPSYDATELRVIDTMFATYDGNVLGAREGTRPGGSSLAVTLSGSPLNWNVASGIAAVSGIASGALGVYIVPVTATETGVVPAADATFPRKDIIVLAVKDAENGDATREALVTYLSGSPAATPSAPAVPSKSLLLATIDVPKTGAGSPSVTLSNKYTVASGGILPTLTRPTAVYAGLTIYNLSSGVMEYHNGTTWLPLSGGSPAVLIQTVAGNATWTKPANAKFVHVRIWGGGGAGGGTTGFGSGTSEGGGGGGGGYTEKMYAASDLNATEAFTVGAGGTGVALGVGNSGGASTFKALTAGGGSGGQTMTSSTASQVALRGAGGTASAGDLNCAGDDGGTGRTITGNAVFANFGGASPSGGGLTQQTDAAAGNGTAGTSPGGGGTGSFSSNAGYAGGNGAAGKILVTTYF